MVLSAQRQRCLGYNRHVVLGSCAPHFCQFLLTACSVEIEEDVRHDQSPICLPALVEVGIQAAGRGARAVPLGAGERSSAQELG